MKKTILGLFIIALSVTLFSGCADMGAAGAKATANPVISRIQERGELVVGTAGDMPPLNMTTKSGDIIGVEADIATFMAAQMGVEARFEVMSFAQLLPALEAGQVDMVMSGMTMTPKRNMRVAFVGPYFISGKAFLTKVETIANADEAAAVNKATTRLTALRGSTSEAYVRRALSKAQLTTAANYDEAVKLVRDDQVHALVADFPVAVVSVMRYPDAGFVAVSTPLTYEPIGVALPANDPLLVNWVENTLNSLETTGALEAIADRWLTDGSWLRELP